MESSWANLSIGPRLWPVASALGPYSHTWNVQLNYVVHRDRGANGIMRDLGAVVVHP